MRHQHNKALRRALGAGIGLVLPSGLLAACATSPASGPAGAAEACTAAGAPVYVTNQLDDTVSVINGRTNQVTATVPAGNAPEGVAVAPDDRRVYIADNGSGTVSVLDTRTCKIVATVRVGTDPSGVGLSPDGRHLYVANGGSNTRSGPDTPLHRGHATLALGTSPRRGGV